MKNKIWKNKDKTGFELAESSSMGRNENKTKMSHYEAKMFYIHFFRAVEEDSANSKPVLSSVFQILFFIHLKISHKQNVLSFISPA